MTKHEDSEDVWQKLANLSAAIEDQQDALYLLVKAARESEEPLTWQQIADAVGITRQAAWERFTLARRVPAVPRVHPGQGKML